MINDRFSIIWGTRQIKNPQLSLYVACAVKQLKGMGIKPQERIAVCDDNSVEYVIFLLALWQIKAVAVPVSPRWPEKTRTSYAAKVNSKHFFRSADIKRAVCFDARQQLEAGKLQDLDKDQELTIVATSGSSGEAKAVLHTWSNHYYNAKGSNEIIPLKEGDRWLLSLPLYHVSGLGIMVRCLLAGAGVVINSDEDLSMAMERGKVTHVSLVATQLQRLVADQKNHGLLRLLKCILLGGSAIAPALIEESLELGLNIYLSYGLTETASQMATGKVDAVDKPCVKTLPYRELSISPDGEILVRGEVLFKGYVNGAKLHLPLKDGWFATNDIGRLEHGYLAVTGRRDSMFISGGENIHPEEIEKALLGIKGIAQAMVVPRDDKEFGARPIAFIQFQGTALEDEYVIRCLAQELPRFKIPVAFLPWPQHLISQGIKISRQEFLNSLSRR